MGNETVAALRTIIGQTQGQFSETVGCSVHTIKSIESGRMDLSEDIMARIYHATGAICAGREVVDDLGARYTKEHFKRKKAISDEASQARTESILDWCKLLLMAAARAGKLDPIIRDLSDWLTATRRDFHLAPHTEAIFQDLRRAVSFPTNPAMEKEIRRMIDWRPTFLSPWKIEHDAKAVFATHVSNKPKESPKTGIRAKKQKRPNRR